MNRIKYNWKLKAILPLWALLFSFISAPYFEEAVHLVVHEQGIEHDHVDPYHISVIHHHDHDDQPSSHSHAQYFQLGSPALSSGVSFYSFAVSPIFSPVCFDIHDDSLKDLTFFQTCFGKAPPGFSLEEHLASHPSIAPPLA